MESKITPELRSFVIYRSPAVYHSGGKAKVERGLGKNNKDLIFIHFKLELPVSHPGRDNGRQIGYRETGQETKAECF